MPTDLALQAFLQRLCAHLRCDALAVPTGGGFLLMQGALRSESLCLETGDQWDGHEKVFGGYLDAGKPCTAAATLVVFERNTMEAVFKAAVMVWLGGPRALVDARALPMAHLLEGC